ncbi:hypothetical protein MC7420_6854 [Coleofasciculus chthonoplastes PCC 7420]|uniref:Helix-turn-helix domain-containing protein n=1 Tax=Coleofasciculus chthonoplastes PCC 7420 TaxID=118168 RepID=B4VWN5_9CYAN|nr:hypothetical protein [Coleofasciculus chthonoplastes]EDX73806.1 hypothetical protein MC7420_6854 [Coleofasciculus chthonoplastes PCC 7420]
MKPLPPQFNNSHTPETTAQQALAEFGITELLSRLKHYRDIDFDASQMHLTDAEVKILAQLFIQELIESLNGKLIAGTLNTLRHGEEMEETFTNHDLPFPTPRYKEGDRVQWKTANPDWGVILGRFYDYNHHQWMVYYIIQLAPDSPSAGWVTTDTASEADVEKIPDTVEPNPENGNSYPYPTHSRRGIPPLSVQCPTEPYNPRRRHNLRPINQREKYIIDLYCYCELGMTPKQFYAKWDVTYEQLSHICSRSLGTVQNWFNRGKGYYPPKPVDLRHLAIMDFLLEHFEEIPQSLLNLLCSSF